MAFTLSREFGGPATVVMYVTDAAAPGARFVGFGSGGSRGRARQRRGGGHPASAGTNAKPALDSESGAPSGQT